MKYYEYFVPLNKKRRLWVGSLLQLLRIFKQIPSIEKIKQSE